MCVSVCGVAWPGQKVLLLLMTLAKIIFLRIFHLLMSKLASPVKKTVHIELCVALARDDQGSLLLLPSSLPQRPRTSDISSLPLF